MRTTGSTTGAAAGPRVQRVPSPPTPAKARAAPACARSRSGPPLRRPLAAPFFARGWVPALSPAAPNGGNRPGHHRPWAEKFIGLLRAAEVGRHSVLNGAYTS